MERKPKIKLPSDREKRDLHAKGAVRYSYAQEIAHPNEYFAFTFSEWRDHWVREGFGKRIAVKASLISPSARLTAHTIYDQHPPKRHTHVGEEKLPFKLIRMLWEPINKRDGEGCISETLGVAYRIYRPDNAKHWCLQVQGVPSEVEFDSSIGWFPICDINTGTPVRYKRMRSAKRAAYNIETKLLGYFRMTKSHEHILEVAKMPIDSRKLGENLTGEPGKR